VGLDLPQLDTGHETLQSVNLPYGTRGFSVAGAAYSRPTPVCSNALVDYLKSSDLSFDCFRNNKKHKYLVNIDN